MTKSLDELMAEDEARLIAEARAQIAADDAPAARAKREARRQAEHAKGVRLGWWNEAGDPIPGDDGEDDAEHDEDAEGDEASGDWGGE